jgi:hypothetical protein
MSTKITLTLEPARYAALLHALVHKNCLDDERCERGFLRASPDRLTLSVILRERKMQTTLGQMESEEKHLIELEETILRGADMRRKDFVP